MATVKRRHTPSGDDEAAAIEDEPEETPHIRKMEGGDVKLEKIVAMPTWREILIELVATKKLDPWNIDIIEITEGYMDRIRKLEMHDLRVPANLILAAAILLRFKSNALKFEEEAQVVEEQTYVEEDAEPSVIPVLELKTRIPPKRMVTLDELLVAMERVFDDQRKREDKALKVEIPTVINIQLPEFNMEERMEKLYMRVKEDIDAEGLSRFTNICNEKTPYGIVATLLPLLHLVQDKKLSIFQEQFFGEIFIRVKAAEADAKEGTQGRGKKGGSEAGGKEEEAASPEGRGKKSEAAEEDEEDSSDPLDDKVDMVDDDGPAKKSR